jgi:hypothetical protein
VIERAKTVGGRQCPHPSRPVSIKRNSA